MSQLLEHLNTEQLQAVTHRDGPLLIVAGAGTGKTTVITRRIAYLIEQGLAKPQEILALTFTEKAANEMLERVDQLLPLGTFDVWISTFHSFCERILKQHGLDSGVPNDFRLLDDVAQWILVHNNFEKFNLDYYRPLGNPNKFIDALLSHFSKCKDELITPESYLEYAEKLKLNLDSAEGFASTDAESVDRITEIKRIEEVAGAFHVYQKLLLDKESLDFADLINYTLQLFEKRKNILKIYQKQFKYILVDEFQDTNFAQYQLIKLLVGTEPASEHQNNLVVVGDDDQSIYKFRGASVSNILKLKEDYPDVHQVTLVQNYRSSQNILDLAYHFIQANNPNRLEDKLKIDKKLQSTIPDAGVIEVLEGKDLSEELDLVVKKIISLKNGDSAATWNDFAILMRANSAANELLPRLDAVGVPYNFVANRGLYRKKLIADLINYLTLLDNYHESNSLYRVLTTFADFSILPGDLSLLTQYAHKKTLSLYETVRQVRTIEGISPDTADSVDKLLGLLHGHSQLIKEKSAVESFVTIIHDLGIEKLLEADTLENAEQREYLDQFYKRIESFAETEDDKSLHHFMQQLDLELQAGSEGPIKFDPNLGPESLKVMTVHASKGLEFKYVFIINLVDQRFPTRGKSDAIEIPEALIKDILPEGDFHLQEERRLFYVALTRAKTHLYLSWGRDYGGAKTKRPSVFLQETKLVPSEKISTATGKVILTRPHGNYKNIVYHTLPTTFSFSEIGAFENCPMDYKFRYYLKLPMPGAAALSFGITIHNVLQHFAEQYKQATSSSQQSLFGGPSEMGHVPIFGVMEELYEQYWVDDWYHSKKEKEEYRKLGLIMLKAAYQDFVDNKPKIKYIEKNFKLPLGDYWFVGKVDRVDSLNGGVAIIDYKTGTIPKTKNKRDLDQLRIYQWAAQEAWGEKVEQLQYWHLKDNKKIADDLASPEQIQEIKKDLLDSIAEIRETISYDLFSDIHKKTKQHTCQFEEFL